MHLCGIFDPVWMVQHGRLLRRVRGLTGFRGLRGMTHLWRDKRQIRGFFAPLRMTTSKVGGRVRDVAGFFN